MHVVSVENDRSLRAFFAASPDATLVLDADLVVVEANRAAGQFLGRTSDELAQCSFPSLFRDDERSSCAELLRRDVSEHVTLRGLQAKGAIVDVEGSVTVVGTSRVVVLREVVGDVVRALRAVAEVSPLLLFRVDRHGVVVWARGVLAKNGLDGCTLVGRSVFEIFGTAPVHLADDSVVDAGRALRRALLGDPFLGRLQLQARTLLLRAIPVDDESGETRSLVVLAVDETEGALERQQLKASEQRFRMLVEGSGEVTLVVGRDRAIAYASPAVLQILGYSPAELVGMPVAALAHPESQPSAHEGLGALVAQAAPVRRGEARLRHKSGGHRSLDATARASVDGEVVVHLRDLSEQRQLEDQLRRAQKMEAVGRLAGGIAHDFNNILAAIQGIAEVSLEELADEDPRREDLWQILEASNRATLLTRQLLAFGRRQMLNPQVVDPAELVVNVHRVFHRLLGADIEFATVRPENALAVRVDPGQLEQVIVNLMVNARDAMPGGGKLTIETSEVTLDDDFVRSVGDLKAGVYARITIRDTGTGMDEATRAHVFEPFFTTKELGRGTGLGLATAFGIVQQSGGHLAVESEPGEGATFHIYLPRDESRAPSTAPSTPLSTVHPGTGTVLIAEDEPVLRELVARVLRKIGYEVLVADDGRQALQVAASHAGPIDLLLTDVTMPRLGGVELAQALLAARPEARVLFMSGHAERARLQTSRLVGEVLEKPFTTRELQRVIRRTLATAT